MEGAETGLRCRVLRGQRRLEAVDQLGLCRVHLRLCRRRDDPGAAVDFGELDPTARPAGPLGAHRVAHDGRWVCVALPSPGMDRLACLLPDAAERDEGPDGMDAGFFLELT